MADRRDVEAWFAVDPDLDPSGEHGASGMGLIAAFAAQAEAFLATLAPLRLQSKVWLEYTNRWCNYAAPSRTKPTRHRPGNTRRRREPPTRRAQAAAVAAAHGCAGGRQQPPRCARGGH